MSTVGGAVDAAASGSVGVRRGLVVPGLLATLAAVAVTTLAAAAARAAGVELEVPADGEQIPLSGIAFVTGVFSVVGVVLAGAFNRWSARPVAGFVRTTVALTAVSLVPPFLVDAETGTSLTLVGLHLLAAAVMIPVLARRLGPAR
ncbi:DUF6069 family protein [Nocardioides lijunqiniae]|uniref:DUF6069 family protein n=1 Tax=Nocardioides lijunqiniae TaxID=2760832 RepID=UPI0030B827EB